MEFVYIAIDCSWGTIGFIDRYSRFIMNDKDEYIEEGYVCIQRTKLMNLWRKNKQTFIAYQHLI